MLFVRAIVFWNCTIFGCNKIMWEKFIWVKLMHHYYRDCHCTVVAIVILYLALWRFGRKFVRSFKLSFSSSSYLLRLLHCPETLSRERIGADHPGSKKKLRFRMYKSKLRNHQSDAIYLSLGTSRRINCHLGHLARNFDSYQPAMANVWRLIKLVTLKIWLTNSLQGLRNVGT